MIKQNVTNWERMAPNKRLKLSAPVPNAASRADIRCCRLTFVNIPAWRRSLSAIR